MRVFPFEIGYASALSDDEMLALSDELERSGWERDQEIIRKTVDDYMERTWRRNVGAQYAWPRAEAEWYSPRNVPSTTHMRMIHLRVPDAVDEPVARVLVEMQLREQLYGEYDPRHPEDD